MVERPALRTLVQSRPARAALAAACAVAAAGAAGGFLDPTSLLIAIGGPLAVAAATFSRARIHDTWRQIGEAFGDQLDPETLILALKRLARVYRVEGTLGLESAAPSAPDPFMRKAIDVALGCHDAQDLNDALLGEVRMHAAEAEAARHVLLTLGKLFPAFGLIGTLVGLVLLLRSLAVADPASVASCLGLAVLTTLYGVILANVVVLPVATKLQTHLARRMLLMQMIVEGTVLVHRREYPSNIERALRLYMGMGRQALQDPSEYPRLATRAA